MKPEDITLDWLYSRVVERDGCLIWTGTLGRGGECPQATVDYKVWPVRRLIWTLAHGRAIPNGQRIGSTCDNDLCVHPDHMVARKPGAGLVGHKHTLVTCAKVAASKRAQGKLKQFQVDEFRASDEPIELAAIRLEVDPSQLFRIRNGTAWRDYSSPFAGLGS